MTTDLKTALLDLAKSPVKRSTTARVAEHFAEIENAFRSGVSRTAILDTLNRYGISINLKTFDNVLYRLRKKQISDPMSDKNTPRIDSTVQSNNEIPNHELSNPARELSNRPKPSAMGLPDDWMTAKLTPEQFRLLSPKQRKARVDAETAQYFPNRFKPE